MYLFIKDIFFGSTLINLLEQHFLANKNLEIIFTVKSNTAPAANYDISWFPELFGIPFCASNIYY